MHTGTIERMQQQRLTLQSLDRHLHMLSLRKARMQSHKWVIDVRHAPINHTLSNHWHGRLAIAPKTQISSVRRVLKARA